MLKTDIQKDRKKYDECSKLLKRIGVTKEDEINNIYDFINEIDKEIKTDKFIPLILNQKDIRESINSYADQFTAKNRNHKCKELNIDHIIKNGISHIEGLIKCYKDYLKIFCDKLCNDLESEYEVKINKFNDIDFTDFKSAYKIVDILNYKFRYQFQNTKRLNLPRNFIETVVFFGHSKTTMSIQICLSIYKLLGGKTDINIRSSSFVTGYEEYSDNYINIEDYEYETGIIKEFAEEIFNSLIEKQEDLLEYAKESKMTMLSQPVPTLKECEEIAELISKKSKKVVEKYKNTDFSKYPIKERENLLHSYIYKLNPTYWTFIDKFLYDIRILIQHKKHNAKSIMICNLFNYGLLDKSFEIISIEVAIEIYKHLYDKKNGKIAKIKDTIRGVYKSARDLFNK